MGLERPADVLGVIAPSSAPLRLALREREAAQALGLSNESFDRYVVPRVRVVRWGRVRVYPVPELLRLLDELAERPLGGRRCHGVSRP